MGLLHRHHHEQAQNAYDEVQKHHEGKLSHEVVAGAGAFMAMRSYEKHLAESGQPANHAFAKEMLAAFAGAAVDKLVETKGLNYMDAEKAKRDAVEHAYKMYDAQFMQQS